MDAYKQPLKEALLFIAFQLGFALTLWLCAVSKSALVNNMCAVPLSSLLMSLLMRKHKWYINWIKYLISGVLMLALSFFLYYIEAEFLIGWLGDVTGDMVAEIWNYFPGALKVVAAVLILLLILFITALFFAGFFVLILLSNVIFTTYVLPKFDELME
jgi:hypothetical protein